MTIGSLRANLRWEALRWLRSQRLFLLTIPVVAGPIGSALAFLYFHVPDRSTALILGIFVTGGLSAIVVLDLASLMVGEDLSRRANLFHFTLPEPRWTILGGRLVLVLGAGLGAYAAGAAVVWGLASLLVPSPSGAPPPLLDPMHLAEGVAALLLLLGAATVTASILTRSASEALVAGVLSAVVVAAATGYLLLQGQLTMVLPLVLLLSALIAVGWSLVAYGRLES